MSASHASPLSKPELKRGVRRPEDTEHEEAVRLLVLVADEEQRLAVVCPQLVDPLVSQAVFPVRWVIAPPSSIGLRDLPVDDRLPVTGSFPVEAAVPVVEGMLQHFDRLVRRGVERKLPLVLLRSRRRDVGLRSRLNRERGRSRRPDDSE